MPHIALYRKYRPITFSEMVGQEDNVIQILKNQIKTNKISHAYIFSGSRGTGKTTAAKIFARAINCENLREDGEPCNECRACKSILSGESTDVVEMDAASNNSVENIRSIRQEVMYASTTVKYKVYIIDEAHMLSTSAFNALLKTLEEPPQDVIFILATTEEHKILPTILSRCIRLEFKKLSVKDIVFRLKQVLDDCNIKYEEKALEKIASLSDGAMRDALSIVERCIDGITDSFLTLDNVNEMLGVAQNERIKELVSAIVSFDIPLANSIVQEVIDTGKDLRFCLEQMLEELVSRITTCSLEEIPRLNFVLKELLALDDRLRQAVNLQTAFKSKIICLTAGKAILDSGSLQEKITNLEMKIAKLEKENERLQALEIDGIKENISENKSTKKSKENIQEKINENEVKQEKAVGTEVSETESINSKENIEEKKTKAKVKPFKALNKVIQMAEDKDERRLYSALAESKAYEAEDGNISFVTSNAFSYDILRKEDVRDVLTNFITDITGKELEISIVFQNAEEKSVNKFEEMMKNTGIDYTNID